MRLRNYLALAGGFFLVGCPSGTPGGYGTSSNEIAADVPAVIIDATAEEIAGAAQVALQNAHLNRRCALMRDIKAEPGEYREAGVGCPASVPVDEMSAR